MHRDAVGVDSSKRVAKLSVPRKSLRFRNQAEKRFFGSVSLTSQCNDVVIRRHQNSAKEVQRTGNGESQHRLNVWKSRSGWCRVNCNEFNEQLEGEMCVTCKSMGGMLEASKCASAKCVWHELVSLII